MEELLQEIKNHAAKIIENRRLDGGACDEGFPCNCSEHEAMRIILAVNILSATPQVPQEGKDD